MTRSVGKGTTWGIAILLALILGNAALSYRNLRQLYTFMVERKKSFEGLLAIDGVLADANDIETGVRGYALTGKPEYLEPFRDARGTVEQSLAELKLQLAGRDEQQQPIENLEGQVLKLREVATGLVDVRDSEGANAAIDSVKTGTGKQAMDAIRKTVADIREREHQSLQHWNQLGDASYRTALVSLFNASAGAVVLVGAVYYLTRREGTERTRNEDLLRQNLAQKQLAEETISKLNRELHARVHELETLLDLMPIGIAIAQDTSCRTISTNPACAQLLGITPNQNASLSASELDRPTSFRAFRNDVELAPDELPMQRSVVLKQPIVGEELEVRRDDGVTLKLLEYVAPLLDESGNVRGCVGVFIDITERKRLEDQLRSHADYLQNQQHWLQALLNLLPVPLLLIEPATAKVTFANRAAHDLAGGKFPVGEPAERFTQVHYFTDMSGFRIPVDRMPGMLVARGERLERFETNWHLPHGVKTLLINADTLPAMHGQEGTAVLLFQDISSLKEVETELRRINQSKDALLAMLGHELRNPLAAIAGSADVVATHSPTDATYQASLAILKRHIKHLTRLVDDMLDLTRLTTSRIGLRLESVDLRESLNYSLQAAQSLIESRRHEVRTELPKEPVYLNADRSRLEQVFSNLLINAAKYTDPGGRIEVRLTAEQEYATVRIRDNGIGIDPAVIPRLFDLFAQVNPTLDRNEAGLGIGLTVVRNLVDLHGGDVQAISAGIGHGSEFIVRLPLGPTPDQQAVTATVSAVEHRTLRVLLVEDNADIAHVMQALIKRCGHEPHWCEAGPPAIEEATRWCPDVGLVDIGLPGMNGYELAALLRKIPSLNAMKLIALTGFGQQEDRRKSEEAGFARHLVKPINFETLQEVLDEALNKPQ